MHGHLVLHEHHHRPDSPAQSTSPIDVLIDSYLSWIGAVGYASDTIRARRGYLRHFSHWLHERGTGALPDLDREQLEHYHVCLAHRRRSDGWRCSPGSVTQRLLAVKGFSAGPAIADGCPTVAPPR